MAAYSPFPVLERLSAAQNRPLLYRCMVLEDILRTTSTKKEEKHLDYQKDSENFQKICRIELRSALPYILQEIFDFEKDQNQGWQLDRIFRSYSFELFERIRHLLSPEGPLMSLINNLHGDSHAVYEFPLKRIPAPARYMIEDGVIPAFYANKLRTQNFSMPVIMLNAFELFVFHLAHALVNPIWQSRNQVWSDLYEFIYPIIVDDYLVYFLPCDKSSLPSLPHIGGPVVRPNLSPPSPGRPYNGMYGNQPSQGGVRWSGLPHRSLFKPSFINAQKQHQQSMPVFDQVETEIWRSETFLQVITEFWLNQNSYSGNEMHSFSGGLPEHFMPSMNHVKMVRMLVKYLHHFANSATSVITSPYQQTVQSPLDQFKRSVIPHILQKKLYAFLRHAFDRWPLDSCFRMVLETWLSYIQPWRYTDPTKRTALEGQHSDTDLQKYVDDKWEHFVEDNLLFYTVLTSEFLPRIHRMDLTSPYSAYMVYRVSRILSLPNLTKLVFKAEQEIFGSMGQQTDLGGSYLSPQNMHFGYSLPSQMIELEGPNFQYVTFFSEPMKYEMMKVIAQISDALETVRLQQSNKANDSKSDKSVGFFATLFGGGGASDIYSTPEYKRLPAHLELAIHNFCNIFSIPRPQSVTHSPSKDPHSTSLANESTYLTESEALYPECVETEAGLKLTDLGRRQLINRERKFDKFYVGDPDLLPVRSYENGTLVRMLFHFCSFINSYFNAEFNSLYLRQDFIGHFARIFLIPPSAPEERQRQVRSPISERAVQLTRSHQARISLRFMASYNRIFQLVIAYFVCWLMFGFGPIGFVFFIFSLVLMYGVLLATVRSFRQPAVQ